MLDAFKNIFKSDIKEAKPLTLDFYLSNNGRRVMIYVPLTEETPDNQVDQVEWMKIMNGAGISSLLQGQLNRLTKDQKLYFISRFNFITGVAIDRSEQEYLPKLKDLMNISRDDVERCRQYVTSSDDPKKKQEFATNYVSTIVGQLIMVAIEAKRTSDYSKAVALINILLDVVTNCQEQFFGYMQKDPTMFTDLSCFLEQYHPELTCSIFFIFKNAFSHDIQMVEKVFKVFETQVKNNPTKYVKSTDFFTHIIESTENICYALETLKFIVDLAECYKQVKPDVLQQINTEDFVRNQINNLEVKLKDGKFSVEKSKFIPQMSLFYSQKKKNANPQITLNPNITYEFNYPCSVDRKSREIGYLTDNDSGHQFDKVKQKLLKQIMKLRSIFDLGMEIQLNHSCNSEIEYSDGEPEIIESMDEIKFQSKRDNIFKSISRIQPQLTQEQVHMQANLRAEIESLQEENQNLKQINFELKQMIEQKDKELQEFKSKQEMQAKIELHSSTQQNFQHQNQSRSQLLLSTMNFGKGSNNQLQSKPIQPIEEVDEKPTENNIPSQEPSLPPPPSLQQNTPAPPPPPPPPPPMGQPLNKPQPKHPKKRVVPSVPVKKVNWQVLDATKVEGTVWDGLDSVELDEQQRKEAEQFFSIKVAPQNNEKATPLKPVEQKISKLDPKRQQSILLALRKMNASTQSIVLALRKVDREFLTEEKIDYLVRAIPVDAEIDLWSVIPIEDEELPSKMSEADLFCIEILKVSGFSQRILSLQFQFDFEQGGPVLQQKFTNILTNFESILVDKKLTIILKQILSIGNFLNGGNNLGGAYGVSLESLVKLDLKSDNNPQEDIWMFIVKQIEKQHPNFIEINENLADLELLAKTAYQDLETQLKYYNTSLKTIIQAKESHDDLDDQDGAYCYFDELSRTVEFFIKCCQSTQEQIKNKSAEVYKYYGCPPRFTYDYFFELIFLLKKKLKNAKIKLTEQETKRRIQELKKQKQTAASHKLTYAQRLVAALSTK